MKRGPDPRELAAEIIRRARAGLAKQDSDDFLPYVVHLSDPPTPQEELQLAACRILGRPIAVMPTKCLTVAEWMERFGR
jgi:hypothetical protein